jgi:hypothetical protein
MQTDLEAALIGINHLAERLRREPFYCAARPRTGEGGLNGAPIPDENSRTSHP